MRRRKTTVRDVAAAAGVSVATVDRVLNGRGGVRPDREARVLEWARKLKIDRSLENVPLRWLRLAVYMQNPVNQPFYRSLRQGFQLAQKTYESHKVMCLLYYFDDLEPETIARGITRVSDHADGLVIVAYEHPAITEALKAVARATPVVTLASDLPLSGRLAYVGHDNYRAGRIAAELMGRFLGEPGGDILVFTGKRVFLGHEERETGFRSVLADRFPACKVVATIENHESSEITREQARKTLRRRPDIRGIYNISVGNREIAEILAELGKGDSTYLVGHDLTDINRELLLGGRIDAVLDQNPYLEALRSVELLLLHHRRIPESSLTLETPTTILLKESLPTPEDRPAKVSAA